MIIFLKKCLEVIVSFIYIWSFLNLSFEYSSASLVSASLGFFHPPKMIPRIDFP